MTEKAPDSPGGASVDEELTPATRESMDRLGHDAAHEGEPAPNPEDRQGDDRSSPGQNSDWLPQ